MYLWTLYLIYFFFMNTIYFKMWTELIIYNMCCKLSQFVDAH